LISVLAEKERIPRKFLELILLELRNGGGLLGKKGKDGPLAPVLCVSETSYHKYDRCQNERTRGIKIGMKEVRDAIAGILDHKTLADLLGLVDLATKMDIERTRQLM